MDDGVALPPGIETIISAMNEKVERTRASYAEQGIAVGCVISIIPLVILILIVFILGIRSWIAFVLIGILGILLAAGSLAFIASRSGLMASNRVYREEIVPEMDKTINDYALSEYDFYEIVYQVLPEQAPLCKLINKHEIFSN